SDGGSDGGTEARPYRLIECRILAEPLRALHTVIGCTGLTEPEIENLFPHCCSPSSTIADIVPPRAQCNPCSPRRILASLMQTSYRDIALLACCQALLLVNNAGLIAMNGLVGYALVDNKALATLGVTSYVIGSALSAMPAALWMAYVGRRRGFMTGSAIAIVGTATCALAIALASYPLYCFGTAIIGVYTAFG